MASIIVLNEGVKGSERLKVMYEVKTLDGKRHRKSKTFKPNDSKRTVESFKRKVEMEYEESEGIDIAKRSFSEFGEEFFEKHIKFLSPTTSRNYRQMYSAPKNGLKMYFGKYQLNKITTTLIQGYVNWLCDMQLSPKSIKNLTMLLHVMIQKAIQLNYLKKGFNPASEIVLPRKKKSKIDAYTEEELHVLLNLVDKENDPRLKIIVYVLVGTGIRRSELSGLKFNNIDIDKKEIEINHSRVNVYGKDWEKAPKTEAGNRIISIPDEVAKVIADEMHRYKVNKLKYGEKFIDSQYLLVFDDGTPCSVRSVYNFYKKFMDKNKSEIRYLSPHKLRHTFASLTVKNHGDIKALQETLGHSSASVTLDTYSHAYKEAKEKQAQVLNDVVFSKQA